MGIRIPQPLTQRQANYSMFSAINSKIYRHGTIIFKDKKISTLSLLLSSASDNTLPPSKKVATTKS